MLPCIAEAIDFADACKRSSWGTSKALSWSLSTNLACNAAVRGGRSVSMDWNCQSGMPRHTRYKENTCPLGAGSPGQPHSEQSWAHTVDPVAGRSPEARQKRRLKALSQLHGKPRARSRKPNRGT